MITGEVSKNTASNPTIGEPPMDDMYRLPEPSFNSELVTLLFEIERLRTEIGRVTAHVETYTELHYLFDTVMSVVSARIEGNHTTVYEALDSITAGSSLSPEDHLKEIINIAATARFIDESDDEQPLTHMFVRELHARTVNGLRREGDATPGQYRRNDVRITGSAHVPPSWVNVHAAMADLLDFANTDFPMNQQMLQISLAHHRFVWIHPFGNGNGRVSRLFTYAMLRRTVFSSRGRSALNPTSVFGNNRAKYIEALEGADSLTDEGDVQWATFFAQGIRDDLNRVIKLQEKEYVLDELVLPTLSKLVEEGIIDEESRQILHIVAEKGVVKAGDLSTVLSRSPSQRSHAIKNLVERNLLRQAANGPRFYHLSLARGPIASRLIRRLDELGHLPKMLSDD